MHFFPKLEIAKLIQISSQISFLEEFLRQSDIRIWLIVYIGII